MPTGISPQNKSRSEREDAGSRVLRTASKVCAILTIVAFLLSLFDVYAHPGHPFYANPGVWLELLFMCGAIVFALAPGGSK